MHVAPHRPELHPDVIAALGIGTTTPVPQDEEAAFHQKDRPVLFGDDVIDCAHGLLNIARNAKTLIGAPTVPKIDAPAIAIGGGPSLTTHLPALRRLQHKCLLVCSQTSLAGLLKEGITPHYCTPMERNQYMEKYTPQDCGNVIFAGSPLCHPDVVNRFKHHRWVPSADDVMRWVNIPGESQVFFGSSTGTTAVNVAAFSAWKSKVYLVGHDLSYSDTGSHWSGSTAVKYDPVKATEWIMGNNGEKLRTEAFWRRLAGQITDTTTLHPGIINVNAHYGVGAKIDRVGSGPLPDPDSLPDFVLPDSEPCPARLRAWKKTARMMLTHANRLDKFFQNVKRITPEETDIRSVDLGRNVHSFSYLMVSLMVQFSYDLRAQTIPRDQALLWFKEATHNVLRNCRGMLKQVQELAEAA
jgi:hypothetical protein